MSENNTARIIELTEIVEEGKGTIQLEGLLGGQDGEEEGTFPASPGRPVDPNESLSMPGMNDMDDMIEEFKDGQGPDDELQALIDGLRSGDDVPSTPDSEKDELDALLDGKEDAASEASGTQAVDMDLPEEAISGDATPILSAQDIPGGKEAEAMMHSMLEELDVPPSGPVGRETDSSAMVSHDAGALMVRLEAMEEQVADLYAKIASLEAQVAADGSTGASEVSEDFVQTVTSRVIEGLQTEIERLSAESAARIIREELSVLLEMEDEG